MFRTASLSIIRSQHCTHSNRYMSYRFWWLLANGILTLLASSQHNLYDIYLLLCTALDSWRWMEKLSETCWVLFQKKIWDISASRLFYYKNTSRCKVLWMSKTCGYNQTLFELQKALQCMSNCFGACISTIVSVICAAVCLTCVGQVWKLAMSGAKSDSWLMT